MALFSRLIEGRFTSWQTIWGSDRDNPASPLASPRPLTRDGALSLSAVFACVRFIADTVATLPVVSEATGETPEWLDRPIPRDPNTTLEVHLQQVATSMLLEGNGFVVALPSVFAPAELRVVDPRQVHIRRKPNAEIIYDVQSTDGQETGQFDAGQMLHFPLIRLPGALRGISPLEAERLTFSAALDAEDLARRFLRQGTWLSAIVESPQGVSLDMEQANALIKDIEKKWASPRNAGRVGVLTGGAKLNQLSVTPEQAQFLETRQYDDERIFRIYRMQPALMGMVREGATSNAASIQQALSFEKHTLRPFLNQLEAGYRRIEPIKFKTKGLLEGDPKTQAQIYHYGLTDTWLDVDEVRDLEDRPRFGGERGGKLQTPNNNAPTTGVSA